MQIAGLQKMTLLDYPGQVACTVFLHGCNFRCPFCHNSPLLASKPEPLMDDAALLKFLETRRGLLDAVCISGGEPTLSPGLPQLLRDIRALGFRTKLDTNGARPDVLRALLDEGLLDYVAMDIKNSPSRYAETAGVAVDLARIEESIVMLLTASIPSEFRTTVTEELHDVVSIREMAQWVADLVPVRPQNWYIQPYADRESVLSQGLHSPDSAVLSAFCGVLSTFVEKTAIRGA